MPEIARSAVNCNTGSILDQQQIQAKSREDVLNSLSEIARVLRTRLGESLATVEKHSMPLDVTTSSLEALKAYSTAMKEHLASGNNRETALLRRVVEIDPNFAMAHANLALSYSGLGESVLAAESATKAFQLRERASERERFFITFNYERAHQILSEHKDVLLKMADALLAREVLDAEQVRRLASGQEIDEPKPVVPVAAATEEETRPRVKERAPIVPALNKPITQE